MLRKLSAVVLALALAAPGLARADQPAGWSIAFEPSASASHVPAGNLQIVVVGAGEASPELRAATSAFTEALRFSGRTGTVIDDSGVGEVGAIDDAKVLARVKALPVTHVAVVRVLAGDPPKALVTIYGKSDGEAVASFIATSGTALAPGEVASDAAPGRGVSSDAVKKVDEVQEEAEEENEDERSEALLEYATRHVGYDGFDVTLTTHGGWASAKVNTRFYLGEAHEPLEGADFYKAVGRDDLAADYESRSSTRTILIVGGLGLTLAGIFPIMNMDSSSCYDSFGSSSYDSCQSAQDAHNDSMLLWGTLLVGAGTLGFTIGYWMDAHPVSDSTRRGLADEHNAQLKSELQLETRASRKARTRNYSWQLTPKVGPTYGGMAFALQF